MKWFKSKKDKDINSNEEVNFKIEENEKSNPEKIFNYDKYINYGVLHIEKNLESLWMKKLK